MSANKVATATEADWTFYSDPRAVQAIDKAAYRAAREFEHVEVDDARQDATLWLAVRPERYTQAVKSDDWKQLWQDVYAHALRESAIAESNRRNATASTQKLEEERGWEA